MAIEDFENENNAARLQAVARRISNQINLENAYRTASVNVNGYSIDIPSNTLDNIKSDFLALREEVKTLENSITDEY